MGRMGKYIAKGRVVHAGHGSGLPRSGVLTTSRYASNRNNLEHERPGCRHIRRRCSRMYCNHSPADGCAGRNAALCSVAAPRRPARPERGGGDAGRAAAPYDSEKLCDPSCGVRLELQPEELLPG